MFEKTWIGATGQKWKAYVMFGLLGLNTSLIVWLIFFADQTEPWVFTSMAFVFLLAALIFFLWTFFAITCPYCGSRVIWTVLRTLPHDESTYVAFFLLSHCPSCKRSFFEKSASAEGRETI